MLRSVTLRVPRLPDPALAALRAVQNGPPLPKYAQEWEAAMEQARRELEGD